MVDSNLISLCFAGRQRRPSTTPCLPDDEFPGKDNVRRQILHKSDDANRRARLKQRDLIRFQEKMGQKIVMTRGKGNTSRRYNPKISTANTCSNVAVVFRVAVWLSLDHVRWILIAYLEGGKVSYPRLLDNVHSLRNTSTARHTFSGDHLKFATQQLICCHRGQIAGLKAQQALTHLWYATIHRLIQM